ncbi:hypothetical protein HWV07_00700 [Natronomonas salina]|uniref:hypothetical protein n=1 Tax=Natronomonas salina TaxID=1710540 RepID=UPI0015B38A75|nr:hypothetical protein [Natronomonas salina]QLD87630.1 hypothetical protein HWV07_00700 [Natronomonas salina]
MTDDDTLGTMSHTNPYTGRVFGDTQTYSRGNTIAADGGEADAVDDAEASDDDSDRLADVSHTPPGENDGAQRAYDRGVDDE